MNECAAGTNDSDTMTFAIDVAHVLENFNNVCLSPSLLANQPGVTLRHAGDCRFVRAAGLLYRTMTPGSAMDASGSVVDAAWAAGDLEVLVPDPLPETDR